MPDDYTPVMWAHSYKLNPVQYNALVSHLVLMHRSTLANNFNKVFRMRGILHLFWQLEPLWVDILHSNVEEVTALRASGKLNLYRKRDSPLEQKWTRRTDTV